MKMMIKRMIPAILLLGALALPAAGQNHIGTIDLQKVFNNYWKRQQGEAALKERGEAMDKDYKGFRDDYLKVKEEYTKLLASAQDQSKAQEERDKAKAAAEAKLVELKSTENTIRTYEENANTQISQQKKRMRDSLLQDIYTAVNAKAKASGYTLVIDTASESFNQTPVVLYTTGENDMTDAILTQLNAGAPPPAAADAPKDSDKKADKK